MEFLLLRRIWFEAALNRWPDWMLAALIDGAVALERAEPGQPLRPSDAQLPR